MIGMPLFSAPGQQVVLDAAAGQVIEHLVRLHRVAAGSLDQFLHIRKVEITDAPVLDFPGLCQGLEGRERFFEWDFFPPMKQVEVKMVGPEALETALAHGWQWQRLYVHGRGNKHEY